MAIVLVNAVCLILIVLYNPTTCFKINSSLCLETALTFVDSHFKCSFDRDTALSTLDDKDDSCQTKCEVKIENIKNTGNKLWEVEMKFGDTIYKYLSPCSFNGDQTKLTMFIDCKKWNEDKVPVGGYCKHGAQCRGSDYSVECELERCVCRAGYVLIDFECKEDKVPVGGYCKHGAQCRGSDYSVECELERCVCRAGYVLIDFECKEGNLALNQSCASIEQCAGSPYASCLGGKCSCLEGYTPENSTDCVQIQKSSLPNSLHPQANTGSIFGALFGGLLIGVILTTAAGAIIYRRSHTNFKKRGELNVFDNDSYANVVHQNDLQIVKTKDKTRELHANSCLGGTSVYSLSSEKPSDRQKQDTVYNHLHEQVKRDDTDYYDHACAVPAYNEDMGDYSHLHQFTS